MNRARVWDDEAGIDQFLGDMEVGCLTTLDPEGWPHSVPLNYLWQGGALYFHTGLGSKIEHIRREPRVCFLVAEPLGLITSDFTSNPCRNTQLGRSVLIRGRAREIRDPERKLQVLHKLIAKYDPEAVRDPDDEQMAPESLMDQPGFQACLVGEIEVASLRGYRHLLADKPEKYRKAAAAHFQHRGQRRENEVDLKTALLLNETFD